MPPEDAKSLADKALGFSTRAVHSGQEPDPLTGAVTVPIYATSTYAQEEIGKNKGYEYSRASNPTRTHLEESLAALEGGRSAHVFASGMAAITALCTKLKTGDHVICGSNVYGGVPRLFNQVLSHYGLQFSYVDTSDAGAVDRAITSATRLVHIETPSNPLMSLTDIRAVADVCHAKAIELSVDNTFMSPYFQRPLEHGADIVMHSTTKFLNGHSDGLGGVLIGTKPEHAEKFSFVQKCTGGILSPFECWLVLRGVKTLAVRMERHELNGRSIAGFLDGHPRVRKVFYPGLKSHPRHDVALRQMTGFGALVTFDTGSFENAQKTVRRLRICSLGESLGGVETLVSHPATMTHASIGEEGRRIMGITDGMLRLSAGIEDAEDLVADLDQALAAI